MDSSQERFILCKRINNNMRRLTEINEMVDHYNQHGTLGFKKQLAMVNTQDMDVPELLFIIKNYPTYKARKLAKANAEKDPDKKAELMKEHETLTRQLDDARLKIKTM